MTQLERLGKLHPDIINNFLEVGESSAIPVKLQKYLLQISWAAEIWQYERNIQAGAKMLRQRILSQHGVKLSVYECRERINDALNFFHVDSNVSQEIWDLHTADRYAAIAEMAVAKGDLKASMQAEEKANYYRNRASSSVNSGTKIVNFLIDPKLKADDLGFENESLKKIAKKSNEGFYLNLINDLPIEQDQKQALYRDADIEDAQIIESK